MKRSVLLVAAVAAAAAAEVAAAEEEAVVGSEEAEEEASDVDHREIEMDMMGREIEMIESMMSLDHPEEEEEDEVASIVVDSLQEEDSSVVHHPGVIATHEEKRMVDQMEDMKEVDHSMGREEREVAHLGDTSDDSSAVARADHALTLREVRVEMQVIM
jgi:hypothetical protein